MIDITNAPASSTAASSALTVSARPAAQRVRQHPGVVQGYTVGQAADLETPPRDLVAGDRTQPVRALFWVSAPGALLVVGGFWI